MPFQNRRGDAFLNMRNPPTPIDVTVSLFNGVRKAVVSSQECTWDEFVEHGLPDLLGAVRRDKKRLPGFVLAEVQGERNDANTGTHTALAIDVDALPDNDLGALQKRASRYVCAMYETASSTDEAPRVRVIAALGAIINPEHVPAARRALAEALELDPDACGTAGALPASQVMFCGRVKGTRERGLWNWTGPTLFSFRAPDPKANQKRAHTSEGPRQGTEPTGLQPSDPTRSCAFAFDSPPDLSAIANACPPAGHDADRHTLVRALGGWLARRGYAPEAIAEAVAHQLPSDTPAERAAQARDAAERVLAGQDAPGWEALQRWAGVYGRKSTLKRLEDACRDPGEPDGFGEPWSAAWARIWPATEAYWRKRNGKAQGAKRSAVAKAERRAGNETALRAVAPDLAGKLETDADGKPYSHAANVGLGVRHYVGHAVAKNAATGRPMITETVTLASAAGDEVLTPGLWEDVHTTRLHAAVCRLGMSRPGRSDVDNYVRAIAAEREVWPIRLYLEALPEWDGEHRTLCTYFGAEETEYALWVCGAWLRSCVARGFVPGEQCDHMLVLEGEQGAAKSTALRVLAGDELFGEFTAKPGEAQKVGEQLQGKWIVELSELDKWTRTYSSEELKSMLTRRDDDYRTPYDRYPQRHPRTAVPSGSTNRDQYLTDDTGNRRYWPVVTGTFDIAALAADREQVWAQALDEYRRHVAGESGLEWWPADPEIKAMTRAEQARRMVGDAWERAVARWVKDQIKTFTSEEVARHAVGLELERVDSRAVARVERCLLACGCVRTETKRGRAWRSAK